MSATSQRICVWAAVPMWILFALGFGVLAGFLPPPSPDDSAEEITAMLRDDTNQLRAGIVLSMVASALLAMFYAVISVQLKRIEGGSSPFTYAQLILAACSVMEFVFPLQILQSAAFRDDRSAQDVQALSDTGWLMFVGIVTTAALQALVIGLAILRDPRPSPVLPRWSGYICLWFTLTLCSGNFIVFFKDGPLAWDGIIAWWLTIAGFAIWTVSMMVAMLQAIRQQETHEVTEPGPGRTDDNARLDRLEAELAALRQAGPAPATIEPR